MDKLLFVLFILIIGGYLYVDNHNQQLKQDFHQVISQCHKQAKSQPKKEIICLADGLPCSLQKDWESIQGMLCLAEHYRSGRKLLFRDEFFGKDLLRSAYWYEQLAQKGYPDAQFEIAKIYEHGLGITQDIKNANAWYYQAYLSGHLESGFILANHFAQGKGIEQNHQQALLLYHQLAESLYEPAIFKMGEIYADGLFGVVRNKKTALNYFQKIPNYKGVSGINGKIHQIETAISIEESIQAQSIQPQLITQQQKQYVSSNTNKVYPSYYYGHTQQPTALCWDGTYSYSLGRRGVCSRHSGIRYWLKH